MPKLNIKKSIFIDSKPEEVYKKISDFHHWEIWSPWLIMEKGVQVDVDSDGKAYSWEGSRVGAGNMKILEVEVNKKLTCDLNFIKPWKSHATIGFDIIPNGTGVDVSWTMNSSLPFFMFWMKKMMEAYVGMDYERGLRMLKDYVEDGKVHSAIHLKGVSNFAGAKFIGIKGESSMDAMGQNMGGRMVELTSYANANNIAINQEALAIYHKWDMVNRKAVYTCGFMVDEIPANLSGKIVAGEIPVTKVNTVEHIGDYEHLGNAWGLQYMMQRGKEFKANKNIDPFEIYKNDPSNTEKKELLTEVYFATK